MRPCRAPGRLQFTAEGGDATTSGVLRSGSILPTDRLRSIDEVAAELGVSPAHVSPRGRDVAKIDPAAIGASARRGKLVLVSAITPTPAGEGKTTVSVGLAVEALNLGRKQSKTANAATLSALTEFAEVQREYAQILAVACTLRGASWTSRRRDATVS